MLANYRSISIPKSFVNTNRASIDFSVPGISSPLILEVFPVVIKSTICFSVNFLFNKPNGILNPQFVKSPQPYAAFPFRNLTFFTLWAQIIFRLGRFFLFFLSRFYSFFNNNWFYWLNGDDSF